MRKKKSSKKQWAVSEKLEIVQARQNGLTLDEVKSLYGVSLSASKFIGAAILVGAGKNANGVGS